MATASIIYEELVYWNRSALCFFLSIHFQKQSAEQEGEEYTVEKILDKMVKQGKVFYLIKWKGYPIQESTWEPEENCVRFSFWSLSFNFFFVFLYRSTFLCYIPLVGVWCLTSQCFHMFPHNPADNKVEWAGMLQGRWYSQTLFLVVCVPANFHTTVHCVEWYVSPTWIIFGVSVINVLLRNMFSQYVSVYFTLCYSSDYKR